MFLLMVKHGSFSLPPGPDSKRPSVNFKWIDNPRDLAEYWLYENELSDKPSPEIRESLSEKIQEIDDAD